MTKGLSIFELGDPILRQQAAPVEDIQDPGLQLFIDRLLHTLLEKNGVGIAAPQVGVSRRLIIVASRPNLRYPSAPSMEPEVMINPRVMETSNDRVRGWEGCLSIPGIRGEVPRHRTIVVEYLDRSGQLQQRDYEEFVARIFQHEFDHLEGKVFLDRLESVQDIMTDREFLRRFEGG